MYSEIPSVSWVGGCFCWRVLTYGTHREMESEEDSSSKTAFFRWKYRCYVELRFPIRYGFLCISSAGGKSHRARDRKRACSLKARTSRPVLAPQENYGERERSNEREKSGRMDGWMDTLPFQPTVFFILNII